MERLTEDVMKVVGLEKYGHYYPKQLSASMLQRVVIARAFAVQPDLLLMDEPYGQLDIELRFRLEDELIKLWKMMGPQLFLLRTTLKKLYILEKKSWF